MFNASCGTVTGLSAGSFGTMRRAIGLTNACPSKSMR